MGEEIKIIEDEITENEKIEHDCSPKCKFSCLAAFMIIAVIFSFGLGWLVGDSFSKLNAEEEESQCIVDTEILCYPQNSTNCQEVPIGSSCFSSDQCEGENIICDKSDFYYFCREEQNACLIALYAYAIREEFEYIIPQRANPDLPCTFVEDIEEPVCGFSPFQCIMLIDNLNFIQARKGQCESFKIDL